MKGAMSSRSFETSTQQCKSDVSSQDKEKVQKNEPIDIRASFKSSDTRSGTSYPATLLSRRIHEKQVSLQTFPEDHDRQYASLNSQQPFTPKGKTLSISSKTAQDGGSRNDDLFIATAATNSCSRTIRHSESAQEHSSKLDNCISKASWGRATSADYVFDADRCRELQTKWVESRAATSSAVLAIETKAKKLSKLPSLHSNVSPAALKALNDLARKQIAANSETVPLRRRLRYDSQPSPSFKGSRSRSKRQTMPNNASNAVNIKDTPCHEYSIAPGWSLYAYLLLVVGAMVLLLSKDPTEDMLHGLHGIQSLMRWTAKAIEHIYTCAKPSIRELNLMVQCSLYETYVLCRQAGTMLKYDHRIAMGWGDAGYSWYQQQEGMGSRIEQTTMTATIWMRDLRFLNISEHSSWQQATGTAAVNKASNASMKGVYDSIPVVQEDLRSSESLCISLHSKLWFDESDAMLWGNNICPGEGWLTTLDVLEYRNLSKWEQVAPLPTEYMLEPFAMRNAPSGGDFIGDPLINDQFLDIDLEGHGVLGQSHLLFNFSQSSIQWQDERTISQQETEHLIVPHRLGRVIESWSSMLDHWIQSVRNEGSIRGIGTLVSGANWITLGLSSTSR